MHIRDSDRTEFTTFSAQALRMMENMSSDVPQLTQLTVGTVHLLGSRIPAVGPLGHVLSSAVRYGFVHAQRA